MSGLEYNTNEEKPKAAGSKTQFMLVLINSVSLIVALAMVGVSAWGLAAWKDAPEGSWENVPTWGFYGALAFGVFVMLISVLGCVGAKKRNKCALMLYILVVLVALVVQIAVATYALGYYNYLGDAKDTKSWQKVDSNVQKYIVDGFISFAKAKPDAWRDLQNYNECCGYNALELYKNDCNGLTLKPEADRIVSTGSACTAVITPMCVAQEAGLEAAYETFIGAHSDFEFCQVKLLDATAKYSKGLGIAAVVMIMSTFIALVAASRLACCVSSKDGGYSEEFGYGGQQQQQTTGAALSGTGNNYV